MDNHEQCIEKIDCLQRNLKESIAEARSLRVELAEREEITELVMIGDRDYFFIPRKEYFVLVEDDANIIIRRKTKNQCPQPIKP